MKTSIVDDAIKATEMKKKPHKDRSPITVRAALLQSLIGSPGYGMELTKRVKEQTQGRMKIGQGSLYPALWDLEEQKLVTSYEGKPRPERGGRRRKYYELTVEGFRKAREEREVMRSLVVKWVYANA